MQQDDQITLRMPARTDNAGLARMLAASTASKRGLSYDEVEDLRLAVDELLYCLLGDTGVDGSQVELQFSAVNGDVVVKGEVDSPGAEDITVTEFSRRILDTVTDGFEFGRDEVRRWFSLTKRSST